MSASGNRARFSPRFACAALAALTFVLPAIGQAQIVRRRLPPIGSPPPTRPAPLPPQPSKIRRDLVYRFSRFSYETYSFLDVTQTDRYVSDSGPATYPMWGEGLRINYRYKPTFTVTTDLATAFVGGPFMMSRFQMGGRFHPERLEYHVRPFVDVRGSWAHTFDTYAEPIDNTFTTAPSSFLYATGAAQSDGFGGFTGIGMDYSLSRNFALSSELGVSYHRMGDVSVGGSHLGSRWDYNATTTSLMIGVKYTGGRYISIDPPMLRQK
jgi:hypothetical protein